LWLPGVVAVVAGVLVVEVPVDSVPHLVFLLPLVLLIRLW